MAKKRRRAFWWVAGPLALLLLVALAAAYLLLQTAPGQEFVLRTALARVADEIEGELEVGGIRSDGLLRGFTLEGVAIRDREGRPFVEADSVQVAYSLWNLARRRIVLRPARVWSPRVTIETRHGETRTNVDRIFRRDDPGEPGEGTDLFFAVRRTEVHDGEVTIRLPLEGDPLPGTRGEAVPGLEGEYQVLRFTGIEAFIPEAAILDPEVEGERFRVGRLALEGRILADPFRLEELRGEVRRIGDRVEVDADRIWFPSSELSGSVSVAWGDDRDGTVLEGDLSAHVLALRDFRWLEPRLPDGEGGLDLRVEGPLDRSRWTATSADLRVGRSRVRGSFGVRLGDDLRFSGVDLELLPFWLEELDPWLEEPLPVRGRLEGEVRGDGPLGELRVDGRVAFDDPDRGIPSSTVEASGILDLENFPAAQDFSARAEPLRYGTLRAFVPDRPVRGEGRLVLTASGALGQELLITAELDHRLDGDGESSRVTAGGSVSRPQDELVLAMDGSLEPLSLAGLAGALEADLRVRGPVRGPVRVEGPLSSLDISGVFETAGGLVTARAGFDVRDPFRRYEAEVSVDGFQATRVFPEAPDPTTLTGSLFLAGAGFAPEELAGRADVRVRDSEVGGIRVERLGGVLEATEGRLLLEELELRSDLVNLAGSGDLGLREGAPRGRIAMSWEVESLENLRPLIERNDRILADTLTPIDREALRMEGIDPDTLPTTTPLAGRAEGRLHLAGGIPDLEADGFVEIEEVLYGGASLAAGRVDFVGAWARHDGWWVEGAVDVERLAHGEYALLRGSAEGRYEPGEGRARIDLARDEREAYEARGIVRHDPEGVDVDLEDFRMELDGVEWLLEAPTHLRFRETAVHVDDLRLVRPAGTGAAAALRVEARGTLDSRGPLDFALGLEGIDLDRVSRMVRIDQIPSGSLDLDLRLSGSGENPAVEGVFQVRDFSLNGRTLSRVEGTLDFRDQLLQAGLEADHEGRRLLSGEGSLPLDLAFHRVEDRFPDRNVEGSLVLDEFPAATILGFVDALEEVRGTVGGRVEFRGMPRDLRTSGSLRLREGAVTIPELGLRATEIHGDLLVREDRVVEVRTDARARGSARVEGTIVLDQLANPDFDLRIDLSGFQAVDRRDLNARVGGRVTLEGSYREPRVGGEVRVEQGVLFVEEFARAAEVVDLGDPAFRDVVDTAMVAVRPRRDEAEAGFLQELFVDVDLAIQRDFWIRSREMNVEIGGDLIVTFDRPNRDLLLVGTLEAVRGSYVAFGRTFQVDEGTVDFPGTPGINPALSIRAVNRIRQRDGAPLNVFAQLGGTLERPRVTLTSDAEPPIPESDLISYLIFGRPAYALGSGEASVLEGVAGAGVQMGIGTVATQLGAAVAREFGVDYFAITEAQEARGDGRFAGGFADPQIEVGQYVGQNLFLAIMLRPLTGLGASAQNPLPGARVEWRFRDFWTAEAFAEDRFARDGAAGFGERELGIALSRVFGLVIYREWAY